MPRLPALLLLAPAMVYAACPNVHVFGARETTASPGYGTAGSVVNSIVAAYSGATAEAINYPACGGQSQCGGVAYGNSVAQGVAAVTSAVNGFNQQCPNTVLVLVGYSQGGQIFDDAYCGGGDPNDGISSTAIPLSAAAQAKIAAAIYMGDPRRVPGLAFNAGTCQGSGFAPRQSGFTCVHSANIQSYCDTNDQYCCSGNSAAIHQGYANEYGSTILAFVKNKVNAALAGGSGSTTTTGNGGGGTTTTSGGSQPTGGGGSGTCSALYGQCGGQGYSGPTCCSSGTCKASNQWYSQCL